MFNEPPYAKRHVRWCESTVREIIPYFLLDYNLKSQAAAILIRPSLPQGSALWPAFRYVLVCCLLRVVFEQRGMVVGKTYEVFKTS
jgi:hypothetical protein